MATDILTVAFSQWDALQTKAVEDISLDGLVSFVAAIDALMSSDSWAGGNASSAVSAKGISSGLVSLYTRASTAQACIISRCFHLLVQSISQRKILVEHNLGDAVISRILAHPDSVVEAANGLYLLYHTSRGFTLAREYVAWCLSSYVSLLTHVAKLLYSQAGAPPVAAKDSVAASRALALAFDAGAWESEEGAQDQVESGGKEVGSHNGSANLGRMVDGYDPPPTASAPTRTLRLFLCSTFVRFCDKLSMCGITGPLTTPAVLDALLFILGASLYGIPESTRKEAGMLLTTLLKVSPPDPALAAWLLRGGRNHLIERAVACKFSMLGALFAVYANKTIVATVSKASDCATVSLGYASAASLNAAREALESAILRSHSRSDERSAAVAQEMLDAYTHMLACALAAENTTAANAIIEADALRGCWLMYSQPASVDEAAETIMKVMRLTLLVSNSSAPFALRYTSSSGLFLFTLTQVLWAAASSRGLHIKNIDRSLTGLGIYALEVVTTKLMRAVSAALEGQRRADAALAAAAAAEAAGLPRPAVGKGEVDWAAIAVGPGGTKGAARRRQWMRVIVTQMWSDAEYFVKVHDICASADLGLVSKDDGPPYASVVKVVAVSPLSRKVCNTLSGFLKELKNVCPISEELVVLHGGVPYGQWGAPVPFS